jgi:hypothetical protein
VAASLKPTEGLNGLLGLALSLLVAGKCGKTQNKGGEHPLALDRFELAKEWLEQFPFVEREVGRQLLRSLRLVSHTQFETGVSNQLIQLIGELGSENVALFSVAEDLGDEGLDGLPRRVPGSSADRIKHLNETLARIYGPRVRAHPTLPLMRTKRMRNVVLIDDFIGSGGTLATYLKNVMSPTVKSWISYKWTKLWVISYGGLDVGVRHILSKGYGLTKERIRLATPAQFSGQFLSPLVRTFCKTYAERTRHADIPFGFGGGAVGMVFEHGCPNNAPVVLWSKGPRYRALFPGRGIPVGLRPAFSQIDVNRPAEVLWDVRQYWLALAMLREPSLERHQGSQWRLLVMLGLASRSGWEDERIAGVLGIPILDVAQQRSEAIRLGMLDGSTGSLTEFGKDLLDRVRASASKERTRPARRQRPLEETYYPLSCAGLVRH